MIFLDRTDSGRQLAKKLGSYAGRDDVVVLGLARGGVPVAYQVASELEAPLDVFVVRKLGAPGHEELAFGAIATGGIRFLESEIVDAVGISDVQIKQIAAREQRELERRERLYRSRRQSLNVKGKTVILVDDGIATGSTTRAAILALRALQPRRLVLAAPVAPASTCRRLRPEVDELVCLEIPESFYAIGEFYDDFLPVSDEEVTRLLDVNAERVRGAVARSHGESPRGDRP